jgi:hypothetical protein
MGPLVSEIQRPPPRKYVKIGLDEGAPRLRREAARRETWGPWDTTTCPPCSWTWTTPCGSLRRRSSARCVHHALRRRRRGRGHRNDSIYGLGGGVFSNDIGRAERSRPGSRPAPYGSTTTTPLPTSCPSAGTSSRASAGNSAGTACPSTPR